MASAISATAAAFCSRFKWPPVPGFRAPRMGALPEVCGGLEWLRSGGSRRSLLEDVTGLRGVDLHARAHGRGHGDRADVATLGRRRLRADELLDHGRVVLQQRAIVRWTMAVRSVRYSTLPDLDSSTALATSIVTVPTFGLGILPCGPRMRPSRPTTDIMSGVAIATSNSSKPSSMRLARSSPPTTSAPAPSASATFAPCANT